MAPPRSCPCRTACTPRCFTTKELTCQHPGPLLSCRAPGLHSLFCRLCRTLGFASCLEGMDLPARFWAFTKWFPKPSATPSPPPQHTHTSSRRKMARWSSVQIVRLPLHSLTPPLLPPAAPVGFFPHPSNSSAPLLSFFFTFQFSHLIPRSAGFIPCLCAHHFRPLPPLSRHPPLATVLAVQPQGLCKVPLGRKKPCLKVV